MNLGIFTNVVVEWVSKTRCFGMFLRLSLLKHFGMCWGTLESQDSYIVQFPEKNSSCPFDVGLNEICSLVMTMTFL